MNTRLLNSYGQLVPVSMTAELHPPIGVTRDGRLAVASTTFQHLNGPSSFSVRSSAGEVATVAAGTKCFIQNLGTNALFVRRGTGATSSAFNYVLQGGGVNDDGTGGSIEIDDFVGVVSVAGSNPRYIAWTA
jgi:hypothetical protein